MMKVMDTRIKVERSGNIMMMKMVVAIGNQAQHPKRENSIR